MGPAPLPPPPPPPYARVYCEFYFHDGCFSRCDVPNTDALNLFTPPPRSNIVFSKLMTIQNFVECSWELKDTTLFDTFLNSHYLTPVGRVPKSFTRIYLVVTPGSEKVKIINYEGKKFVFCNLVTLMHQQIKIYIYMLVLMTTCDVIN